MRKFAPSFRFAAVLCASVIGTAIVAGRVDAPVTAAQQPVSSSVQVLSAVGRSELEAIAASARNPDLRWPDFAPYKTEFNKFYASNGYSLRWAENGRPRPQALSVIEVLKNADGKGLEPEDYDASRWAGRLEKLRQNPSEQDLVSFDTALTVSSMR